MSKKNKIDKLIVEMAKEVPTEKYIVGALNALDTARMSSSLKNAIRDKSMAVAIDLLCEASEAYKDAEMYKIVQSELNNGSVCMGSPCKGITVYGEITECSECPFWKNLLRSRDYAISQMAKAIYVSHPELIAKMAESYTKRKAAEETEIAKTEESLSSNEKNDGKELPIV